MQKTFEEIIRDFVPSKDARLDALLKFTVECDAMTHIARRTMLTDGSRRENDAEHSWHIALMALYFKEYFIEEVDVFRAASICVVHDLVEIYAGDTFAYDVEANKNKAEREKAAADKLFSHLPPDSAKKLRALWEEFEEMKTPDSRYANCLDRIQPFLHNSVTGGGTWREAGVDIAAALRRAAPIKDNMPKVWEWILANIDAAVQKGWVRADEKSASR